MSNKICGYICITGLIVAIASGSDILASGYLISAAIFFKD